MSRFYFAPFQGTVTNAGGDTDLLQMLPADDKPIKLVGLILGQFSEVGDAAEEIVRISIIRLGATISGADGSAVTVESPDSADTATGATVTSNDTGVATTSGATDVLAELSWNLRNSPYEIWFPEPMLRPKAKQGEGLFIRLQSTVADDISLTITAIYEEE